MTGPTDVSAASGRTLFGRYKALIGVFCSIIRLIPRPLRNLLWDMSRPYGGQFSLLLRYALLKADAETIGENVFIGRNVTILNRSRLKVGNNVSIHETCYIDAIGGCSIGNDVSIAHGCSILSFDHTWDDLKTPIKYNPIIANPVNIADDVWIGAGVRVLSNVTIGSRSIIAAGAVVTRSVAAGSLYGGVPARKLRNLDENEIENSEGATPPAPSGAAWDAPA